MDNVYLSLLGTVVGGQKNSYRKTFVQNYSARLSSGTVLANALLSAPEGSHPPICTEVLILRASWYSSYVFAALVHGIHRYYDDLPHTSAAKSERRPTESDRQTASGPAVGWRPPDVHKVVGLFRERPTSA